MQNIGLFLLALWLIGQNVIQLFNWHFPYEKQVLPALALLAGISLLWPVLMFKSGKTGLSLLSIWLIAGSSLQLFHISFLYSDIVLSIIALCAGIFLIKQT